MLKEERDDGGGGGLKSRGGRDRREADINVKEENMGRNRGVGRGPRTLGEGHCRYSLVSRQIRGRTCLLEK